jgi:hypothetical protein
MPIEPIRARMPPRWQPLTWDVLQAAEALQAALVKFWRLLIVLRIYNFPSLYFLKLDAGLARSPGKVDEYVVPVLETTSRTEVCSPKDDC